MTKKVLFAVAGTILGIIILLLIAVGCVLYVDPVRQAVLKKALPVAQEKSGYDIDMGDIYLSPFHHSPMLLYRAYKGKEDLPLEVKIDSLFVGHRGQDTLVYSSALRLNAILKTGDRQSPFSDFTSIPIAVEQLRLDETTFHSDSMIAAVGVDVIVGLLDVHSPELILSKGQFPLHGLRLNDAYIGIDLRDTPPDTTAHDTTPTLMAFDVPDGELRNVHFALTPTDLHVRTKQLSTNVLADVGGNLYDARRLNAGGTSLTVGSLFLPFDTLYGNARVDLAHNLITSSGLHARSDEIGATADLQTTELDLETMCVDVTGDAEYQGSKTRLRASYDIDDEIYDATLDIERVNISPFLKDAPPTILAGNLEAKGKGIDTKKPLSSRVKLRLDEARYGQYDLSHTTLDASTAATTSIALDAPALKADISSPMPLLTMIDRLQPLINAVTDTAVMNPITSLQDLTKVEIIRQRIPEMKADIRLRKGSPIQSIIDYTGFDINEVSLALKKDSLRVKADINKADLGQFNLTHTTLEASTDSVTSLALNTQGFKADFYSPMSLFTLAGNAQPLLTTLADTSIISTLTSLRDLTLIDTIRQHIPALKADLKLRKGSPIQPIIDSTGLDINEVMLSLKSDKKQTDIALEASIPDISHPEDSTAMRLPAAKAAMHVAMTDGKTTASIAADSKLTDGAMSIHDLGTDAAFRMDLTREQNSLNGDGRLTLDNLSYGGTGLGSRTIDIQLSPSKDYEHALRADVRLDDIPLDIIDGFVTLTDIALHGAVRGRATIDGLPQKTDISAEVLPVAVRAEYKPYEAGVSLGETPIVMEHNHVDFNGLPIYGVDSTFVALTGGLDLDAMKLDVVLQADSFAPAKLKQDGKFPVYGDLATDIRGKVYGPLDSIMADVDVTILPTTDITYPIDKKNLAQINPYGTVNVHYSLADTTDNALTLGGQINVDKGTIRYSPKLYPVMPFSVDSGSRVAFQGPLGQTLVDVSASQRIKADVESKGEETRRVDFITGVRVNGVKDSIGLSSLGFFLEAPEDETITRELASLDEETREGLAATLLTTGMYVGESNEAAQRSGYALSSIINSRINAAMANSKMGKIVDIDISSAQTNHAVGKTNDMNISISKSFLKDKLRVTIGTAISDNPEVNNTNGLLQSITADYKLTDKDNILLRLFSQRDYNNVLEGELYKSGLGVRAVKEWHRQESFRGDSIKRTHDLITDAGVAYRSNNSIGPDLTLKSSIKNLLGNGETFTIKGNGAYYWAFRNRHPGDPKKTDTYKLGLNASLVFPYLHWSGDNKPDGDTRYMLGYQYENIAGGYGVHKVSGSLTYFFRTSRYVTHAFTPVSLSIVKMKAESDSLLDKAAEYPQLIKVIAGDEFVPSVGYNFIYNDYRSKRAVNTMLDLNIKESGNILNALYCAFGHKWSETDKSVGKITFNQFVKLSAELHNKFNFTDKVCIATRIFAGANIPLGNSVFAPLSEAFYAGGLNSMRSAAPYAYGPGNFYSAKYNQNFFHAGDVKLEANFELRFPIVWKIFGAAFVDAGNVWNWYSTVDLFKAAGYEDYLERLEIPETLYDGLYNNPEIAKQIALGTGAGLRLDLEGLVVRLDFGVALHAPYQTFRYNKETWTPDTSQPINTYYNIPSGWDVLRINFGIGYPF